MEKESDNIFLYVNFEIETDEKLLRCLGTNFPDKSIAERKKLNISHDFSSSLEIENLIKLAGSHGSFVIARIGKCP